MTKIRTTSMKAQDWLLEKIKTQRNEITDLGERGIADRATTKKRPTGRRANSFHIEIIGVEGMGLSQAIYGDIRDTYRACSAAELTRAASESIKANTTLKQGLVEDSIKHYIRAERSLGAVVAFLQVEKVTSEIARAKANLRHVKTISVRARVLDLWRKEFNPKLSAEHVAEEIVGRFHWKNGKFVSHRTIAEWISAEKKQGVSHQ